METNTLGIKSETFYNTTHFPEKMVNSVENDWKITCSNITSTLQAHALPEGQEQVKVEADKILRILKSLYQEYYAKRGRCANWFITGPAKFNFERNRKRMDSAEKVMTKANELEAKLLNRAKKRLRPDLAPIMAGDDDAVTRLEARIEKNKEHQQVMKRINKICRDKKISNEEKAKIIKVNFSFSDETIHKILNPIASYYSQGFQGFELTNLNATIKNDEKRLARLKRAKTTLLVESITATGIKIIISQAENRVKLFFDGKPESSVRETLKKNGFRWAPSEMAWKAYINDKSLDFIKTLN